MALVPPTTSTTTTSAPMTTTTTLAPSPLTGLGIADPAAIERRVIAVKIDNHRRARPQSGLQTAEVVIELLVESGITRFIALFHSVDTSYVGPIRSVRPTDPTLLKPLGAPIQISGGQRWIRSLVDRAGVEIMGSVAGSTFRIGTRSAPHNLYGDTAEIRNRADGRGYSDAAPSPMFEFGRPTATTEEATEILFGWSRAAKVRWIYDGEAYLRFQGDTPHGWVDGAGNGGQIAFDVLVVLAARPYTASPPAGVSGSSVPAFDTVGIGKALAFFSGGVVEGTWSRDSIEEPFALSLANGPQMVLPAGRMWVSLFPADRSVTWQ